MMFLRRWRRAGCAPCTAPLARAHAGDKEGDKEVRSLPRPPSASAHLLGEREQHHERARLFLGEWSELNRLERRLEKKEQRFPQRRLLNISACGAKCE